MLLLLPFMLVELWEFEVLTVRMAAYVWRRRACSSRSSKGHLVPKILSDSKMNEKKMASNL